MEGQHKLFNNYLRAHCKTKLTASQRRRLRRKTLKSSKDCKSKDTEVCNGKKNHIVPNGELYLNVSPILPLNIINSSNKIVELNTKLCDTLNCSSPLTKNKIVVSNMEPSSEAGLSLKSRDDVKAAREAKKLAKQAKKKGTTEIQTKSETQKLTTQKGQDLKNPSVDEVDRAEKENKEKSLHMIKEIKSKLSDAVVHASSKDVSNVTVAENLTVNDVVNTLKDIVNVAKNVESVTAIVKAMDVQKQVKNEVKKQTINEKTPDVGEKKMESDGKSKAELKAERRAKQEAQRAAKQAQQQAKEVQQKSNVKTEQIKEPGKKEDVAKEKSPKPKLIEKKVKSQSSQKCNWFQHLHTEHDKEALRDLAINSNLHPAVIKLGVQLASHVVTGSNARCIALLDALKKMVRDYSLPAKTEFARGLEAQLAASLSFLWRMRAPSASQVNAIKHFRHQLTQLPNNVDEFDAKKKLQEEMDRYIREQIDMAGEAISIAVRNKISNGDNILTYGCSSLIERILRESHEAGVQYRAVVVGNRVSHSAREMLRRLIAAGVSCSYVDISALSFVMKSINKVLLGANALLVNGSVLGAVGTLQAALVARAHNVPVLVACETHKFSDRVQTDAFVYNEIGDPEALIDKSDENSLLKDWRSNPNLNLLNLTYDVTPASLVTAVVTELAILPCTSAPVVLRFKTSEYGM
ncbi:unnamed protein product [Leptosia nina]|uniref:Translation initiation factor eIF2B subunit delta n=1 Tax=Leptosia nina TaxID=320188 RepID=A0AAV1J885_9NEOP